MTDKALEALDKIKVTVTNLGGRSDDYLQGHLDGVLAYHDAAVVALASLTRLGQQGSAERKIPEHIAKAINDLCDYAQDLDLTERPAIGEYDVTADIRTVCDFGVNAYLGQPIPPPKP